MRVLVAVVGRIISQVLGALCCTAGMRMLGYPSSCLTCNLAMSAFQKRKTRIGTAAATVITVEFFPLLCCIATGLNHLSAVLQAAHNTTALSTANRCQVPCLLL
jgi:hypothetical protein